MLKRSNFLGLLVLVFVCVFAATAAQAALVTTSADIPPPTTIIDFSDQGPQLTLGPTQVGNLVGRNVVFTAGPCCGGFSSDAYGLADNGFWGSGFTYALVNNGLGSSIRFTFNDGLLAGVGGFVNYAICGEDIGCGSGDFVIQVLDSGLNVLESCDISQIAPISTPNGLNQGAFRGIVRPSADIFAFELVGGVGVIDDLTFTGEGRNGRVPGPATLALYGLGFAALAFSRRRRRADTSGSGQGIRFDAPAERRCAARVA